MPRKDCSLPRKYLKLLSASWRAYNARALNLIPGFTSERISVLSRLGGVVLNLAYHSDRRSSVGLLAFTILISLSDWVRLE